ncbi:PAB-dependent poly(A)-specific ribonuclease subunit PAN2, partial [Ochromonadaceae sp. CCMP2298]
STPHVGLENNVPNSEINPILQLLYALVPVRNAALLAQLRPYHHKQRGDKGGVATLLCELGFLFHMMRMTEQYWGERESSGATSAPVSTSTSTPAPSFVSESRVDKVVRAATFQRIYGTFQLSPEAVALSLFDEALQADLQQYVQIFAPFLLKQLGREIDQEAAAARAKKSPTVSSSNVVDDLFGFSTLSSTSFLHSGTHKVDPTLNRAISLEIIYPALLHSGRHKPPRGCSGDRYAGYRVTGAKGRANVSFAATLWGSFQKQVFMKGWCKESEAFEPFKKVQTIASLPRVLTLLCGNTQSDVKDSSTLAGALGETQGQGSTHENYWSCPLL